MRKLVKLLCVLMCLTLLPFSAGSAEQTAAGVDVTYHDANDRDVEQEPLKDGDQTTGLTLKRDRKSSMVVIIPDGETVAQLYVSLDTRPASVELQTYDGRKWSTVTTLTDPGAQFVIRAEEPLTAKARLLFNFSASVAATVTELYAYTDGTLPDSVHDWKASGTEVDVLLAADSLDDVDPAKVSAVISSGHTMAVGALDGGAAPAQTLDALWEAGLRIAPRVYSGKQAATDVPMVGWIRTFQPLLLLTQGSQTALGESACADAVDASVDIDSAAAGGLWSPNNMLSAESDLTAALDNLGERSQEGIREACRAEFAGAEHADASTIPWPEDRLEDGYMPEGEEFVYEDEENGLWAYASSTVQVQILRYKMPEVPHLWYMADVQFKPEYESFEQHVYTKATFEGQQIYPETLAQNAGLVIAVNGDYYPYRVNKKANVGNIIRQRKVLYEYNPAKPSKYPCLDTLALRDDGTLSVYGAGEITAEALLAQGDVHDALSFGPYLARNGKLRVYNGSNYGDHEPRCAIGMIEAGHYVLVMVEGKMPKGGEQGMDLNQLARLMYAQGVTDAFNIDGGSTAVMVFMGRTLNRTGKGSSLGSPRNQHELFGVGTSTQVHTDMLNGK